MCLLIKWNSQIAWTVRSCGYSSTIMQTKLVRVAVASLPLHAKINLANRLSMRQGFCTLVLHCNCSKQYRTVVQLFNIYKSVCSLYRETLASI